MSGVFIPIFPICFQLGTTQNPCRCKVVGPTLGMSSRLLSLGRCQVSYSMLIIDVFYTGFVLFIVSAVCLPLSLLSCIA